MTMKLRAGLIVVPIGPKTPPGETQPLDQAESTHGSTGPAQLDGRLAGVLSMPIEITQQIASFLGPRSRIAMADSQTADDYEALLPWNLCSREQGTCASKNR